MSTRTADSPARTRHLPALDGVRGLAVLIVFLFHYGGGTHSSNHALQAFGFFNKGGWTGVVLFFVLSGFLITGILWDSFDDEHWWRKFFARRSLRIFPLYFLALVLVVLAAIPGHTAGAVLKQIWVPALFLENMPRLSRISDTLPSPLPIFHLWSIAVEEQFYLIWPWLLTCVWRKAQGSRASAKRLCLWVFAGACVFRLLLWHISPEPLEWEHFLLTEAGALALGGWLALAYRGPEWLAVVRWAPAPVAVGAAGFLASGLRSGTFESGGRHMMTFGLPFVSVLFTGVIALVVGLGARPGVWTRFFSLRPLRFLGGISYGVYVFHMLLLHPIGAIAARLAGNRGTMALNLVQFIVAAVLSLVAALISYHLFEKQFLRLKKYFVPRTAAPSPAEPTPEPSTKVSV